MGKGVGSNGGSASLALMQHLFTEHWAGEGACLMCQALCSASQDERDEGPVVETQHYKQCHTRGAYSVWEREIRKGVSSGDVMPES